MKIKAIANFAGIETMHRGEIKNVTDEVAFDLIKCGYAEAVEETKIPEPPAGGSDDGTAGDDDNAAGKDGSADDEDSNATPPAERSRKSAAKSNDK